jgi:hypothetical protein
LLWSWSARAWENAATAPRFGDGCIGIAIRKSCYFQNQMQEETPKRIAGQPAVFGVGREQTANSFRNIHAPLLSGCLARTLTTSN